MSTKKGLRRWAVLAAASGMVAVAAAAARADVVADQAAAIIIFPKIEVDARTNPAPMTGNIDTIVQVTNTSNSVARARCFYVRASSLCVGGTAEGTVCTTDDNCGGGHCTPQWQERDFQLFLTKRQPLEWRASQGLLSQCPPSIANPEDPVNGCPENRIPLSGGRVAQNQAGGPPQDNGDTFVPPTEDQFVGELKCVEVNAVDETPIDLNDLKGEATIVRTAAVGAVDVRKYNAIGIQSAASPDGDPSTLTIGGPGAEYNACPNVIILDHFFDSNGGTGVTTHAGSNPVSAGVATNLVVVPCSEDFLTQNAHFGDATLQFLIYNEFEQRFSTSTRVSCYRDVKLSDIDTRPGPNDDATSIFSASVQGTLTGQSRIRAVPTATGAHKVLAIVEESWDAQSSELGVHKTARNVQNIQPVNPDDPAQSDFILLSPVQE
ncbi:MAG TPA: hypothetical protein VL403_02295 [Candidatus Kryptonia bacterium]|nr:hypothetical protein [Candidatus Kryptonia bacterium]